MAAAAPGWTVDEARALKLEPDQVEARVVRSALGAAVFAHFRRIAEFTPEIKPLYCEIMPDHLHLILQVVRPIKRPLGNAIAGWGCSNRAPPPLLLRATME